MKPTVLAADSQTDIVIDLGCLGWPKLGGVEDSILTLIKRFHPKVLFGFDLHPALTEKMGDVDGTLVITSRRAAWTHNSQVGFSTQGNCTHVDLFQVERVEAFDLAAWVRTLPEARIVLKVDVEGAEYVLLPHLIDQGVIDRFSRILVEWHDGQYANSFESDRASILEQIPVPVEDWQ